MTLNAVLIYLWYGCSSPSTKVLHVLPYGEESQRKIGDRKEADLITQPTVIIPMWTYDTCGRFYDTRGRLSVDVVHDHDYVADEASDDNEAEQRLPFQASRG